MPDGTKRLLRRQSHHRTAELPPSMAKTFGLLFERTIVVLCKQGGFIVGLPGDSASYLQQCG
jgi:hypothetical protein